MPRSLLALATALVFVVALPLPAAERTDPVPTGKAAKPGETPNGAKTAPGKLLSVAELDALVAGELSDLKFEPVSDEQFLRRVSLDLVGRQPTLDELEAFLADTTSTPDGSVARRAAAVERLLDSDEFGVNWANYWSDTISYHVPPPELSYLNYRPLKEWLAAKLNANAPWNEVTRDILTASGMVKENPPATFVAYHQGNANKLAAETARIFLGVQIQCAECHDHPFEEWKREQFHQLAAFYARAQGKLTKTLKTNDGTDAVVKDGGKGEHVMPNAEDPKKQGTTMAPVFMTGQSLPLERTDAERRGLLADSITDPSNPWFARAYVNRIWSRLMGRGFFEPVDDMGGHRTGLLPKTHRALAESFAASGYDTKAVYRLVVHTAAYQRQLPRPQAAGTSPYAAATPGKLRGDEVFDSLVTAIALPNVTPPAVAPTGAIRFPPPPKSTRDLVADTFGFDPSLAPSEVFRSMGQAMLLMNNDQLQAQINASPDSGTMLSQLLAEETDDREVVERLFLAVLARQPTAQETSLSLKHLRQVGRRGEACEDLLWSLINSAEFTTKR